MKFNTTMMVDHPLEGIKQFKVRFKQGKFFSVIGGYSDILNVNGDGKNSFELYFSSDETNYGELEPFVDIERINVVLGDMINNFGQPVEINGEVLW